MIEKNDDLNKELFDAAIESGRNALKSGMVINGAASISMLTFVGGISSDVNAKIIIKSLSIPLSCFVLGVLLCALASGATYIAQTYFYHSPEKCTGKYWNIIGIFLVASSYLFFAIGSHQAYRAFLNWP